MIFENGMLGKIPPKELNTLAGEIMQIWLAVKTHRNTPLREFERSVFPPIDLNQFRIYKRKDVPIGFVSWAYFTPELGKKYIEGEFEFLPEYWQAGEQVWFIDFISPYGDAFDIAADLKTNVFPDSICYAPLVDPKTNRYRKRKFHGINIVSKQNDATNEALVHL